MIATAAYITRRFAYFNDLIYRGRLPLPRLAVSRARSYVGQLSWRRTMRPWAVREGDYCIRVSTAYDLPETELDDVLIHEMIHYDIALSRVSDTSAHGRVFRSYMADINRRFGRHVTVSRRDLATAAARAERPPRRHAVAVVTFRDGRMGLKVLPMIKERTAAYLRNARRAPDIATVRLYTHESPLLERFPVSSVFRVHILSAEEISRIMEGASAFGAK